MSAVHVSLKNLDAAARARVIADAAALLRDGKLVVLPTETIYGVACLAGSVNAVKSLVAASGAAHTPGIPGIHAIPNSPGTSGSASTGPAATGGTATGWPEFTWHAADAESVVEILGITHAAHRRLISKFAPGPVRFLVELGEAESAAALARLAIPAGVIDRGGLISCRVPDHADTRAVLAAAGSPVVIDRVGVLSWGSGREVPAAERTRSDSPVAMILDDGPARLGKPSTAVRLTSAGGYQIVSEGALESRTIDRAMERLVLFVCTGNTCRSPMAEAIARHVLEGAPLSPLRTRVASAGTTAGTGDAASAENAAALRAIGVPSLPHRSRGLTRQMIADADVIYTMTASHRRAVVAMDPAAAGKTQTLDPDGDVPDPIGAGESVYADTAKKLDELIRARFAAMGLLDKEHQSTGRSAADARAAKTTREGSRA